MPTPKQQLLVSTAGRVLPPPPPPDLVCCPRPLVVPVFLVVVARDCRHIHVASEWRPTHFFFLMILFPKKVGFNLTNLDFVHFCSDFPGDRNLSDIYADLMDLCMREVLAEMPGQLSCSL
ncbi:hypothetical protein EJB05_24853 [Eragrostis curvula]|uniref:Uncharacterized protein n=1 Tax=Eragrostis curvula TaxID=38414 RepID=A0A5J9VBN3_9POAL|nr:hypothetical protein EJB05_24853 [Eragrostis curvula]